MQDCIGKKTLTKLKNQKRSGMNAIKIGKNKELKRGEKKTRNGYLRRLKSAELIMNMDAYNERKREYYQANKEKINERTRVWASQQITCECGINCRKDWISKRKKSKAHIIWMKQQKEVTEPDK